jgi:RNA polymerase sigma factor (sigma-70 family)
MTTQRDPALLHAACLAENPETRQAAYRELGDFLLRITNARLRSKPDLAARAEECAQEAIVTVWQKLEAGQGPEKPERFVSWAASIAVHKVFDELRRLGYTGAQLREPGRTKRVPHAHQASLESLLDDPDRPARLADATALDPEASVEDRADFASLLLAIRNHPKLSDHSRNILVKGFLAELDDGELAEHLSLGRPNVQVVRSRNLKKLREDQGFLDAIRAYYEGPPAHS